MQLLNMPAIPKYEKESPNESLFRLNNLVRIINFFNN